MRDIGYGAVYALIFCLSIIIKIKKLKNHDQGANIGGNCPVAASKSNYLLEFMTSPASSA